MSGDLIQQLLDDLAAERALADQLAKALRAVRADRPTAHTDAVWVGINTALETYEETRPIDAVAN